jgi:hypothetical protein
LLLAALGLFATAIQVHRNRAFQKENTAKGVYRDYLKMAVENPILADGDLKQIKDGKRMEQYRWFVSYLLWACEEIITFAPNDPQWKEDVESQLGYHLEYLSGDEFRAHELSFYSTVLQDLIKSLIKRCPAAE